MSTQDKHKLTRTSAEKQTLPILVVLLAAILPLFFKLPFWVLLWCFVLWGYVLFMEKRGWPRPGRAIRLGLTAVGCLAVVAVLGGYSFSGSTFIGLLAIMAGLKPLEVRNHRDRMVTIFMIYFIIITSLFVIENLLITLYLFPAVLVTTAELVYLNQPDKRPADTLRLSAVIMVQAIPLMVLLFLFFPRFKGTFYGVPGTTGGRSGFSETMQPGSISSMVTDNSVAFRVKFLNKVPPPEQLYWRGLVLWNYDGLEWTRGDSVRTATSGLRIASRYWYDITLEPHNQRYLFGLDIPMTIPSRARMMEDHTIITRWPVKRTYRYNMKSYGRSDGGGADISERVRKMALQLPLSGNAASRELAQKWVRAAGAPAAVIDEAIGYFQANAFAYTLNPTLLGENRIDEFLFESREGYCEHYASAFAFLMRAAGIPARVVVGYLGGDENPYGDYTTVKQYHAHAWTEVFLNDAGWQRVDPTMVIVPQRISMGLAGSLSPEDLPSFLNRSNLTGFKAYREKVRLVWDTINLRWDAWFMGFSRNEQRGLWTAFFIRVWAFKVHMLVVVMLIFVPGAIVFFNRRRLLKKGEPEPVREAYDRFCSRLGRIGIQRNPSQGPVDFGRMVGLMRGDLKTRVDAIIETYARLRYGPGGGNVDVRAFARQVKQFNPDRRARAREQRVPE